MFIYSVSASSLAQGCRCVFCRAAMAQQIRDFSFRPNVARLIKRDEQTLPPVPGPLIEARVGRYMSRSHERFNKAAALPHLN